METLQNYVLEWFSDVPNNKLPPDDFSPFISNAFNTPEFSKIYYVKPTNELTHVSNMVAICCQICNYSDFQLSLTWSLPPLIDKYKINPLRYLAHLLGDEGRGSLAAYLRKKYSK